MRTSVSRLYQVPDVDVGGVLVADQLPSLLGVEGLQYDRRDAEVNVGHHRRERAHMKHGQRRQITVAVAHVRGRVAPFEKYRLPKKMSVVRGRPEMCI